MMKKKIRDTSRVTYKNLLSSGVLGKLQEQVLFNYKHHPNSTDKEISLYSGMDINVVSARRNELVKLGVIGTKEKRPCKVTGRLAHVWYTRKLFTFFKPGKIGKLKCSACDGKGWVKKDV